MGGIKNKLKQLSNKITLPMSKAHLPSLSRAGQDSIKSSPAKGRQVKTIGFQPVGLFNKWNSITKYTGIACLSLAILSTLILNIVSSYSYSKINSNAEPVSNSSASTLANTELDPASISISISSYPSSSSTGGNNPNLSLSIPQGGGIATGRHIQSEV